MPSSREALTRSSQRIANSETGPIKHWLGAGGSLKGETLRGGAAWETRVLLHASAVIRRLFAAIVRLSRAENDLATRYAGWSWSDAVERAMINDLGAGLHTRF